MAAIATDDCNSWTGLVQEMENKVAKEHYVQHHMHFGPDFEQTPLSLSCVECQGTGSFLSSGWTARTG